MERNIVVEELPSVTGQLSEGALDGRLLESDDGYAPLSAARRLSDVLGCVRVRCRRRGHCRVIGLWRALCIELSRRITLCEFKWACLD